MTQSVTGVGLGSANTYTTKELAILANGPTILVAGRAEVAEGFFVNPPSPVAFITLSQPLEGSHTNYIVQVTGLNTGDIYVAQMSDDDDGNFYQFVVLAEGEGTCMYCITKAGVKPNVD